MHCIMKDQHRNKESTQTMRAAIINELTTEPLQYNGQQPKLTCDLLISIFILELIGVNSKNDNLLT